MTGTPTRCPTCSSPVIAVAGDEGTSHYEPAGQLLLERANRVEWLALVLAATLARIADAESGIWGVWAGDALRSCAEELDRVRQRATQP